LSGVNNVKMYCRFRGTNGALADLDLLRNGLRRAPVPEALNPVLGRIRTYSGRGPTMALFL